MNPSTLTSGLKPLSLNMLIALLAESSPPAFDLAWALGMSFRVLHITGAAIIVGGMAFLLQAVVAPAGESAQSAFPLPEASRAVWSRMVALATAVMIVSGFYNYYNIVTVNEKLPGLYHALFGIKFLLALVVFFVAAATAGKSKLAAKMQANLNRWLACGLVAAIGIFAIGATLRSFDKVPKADDKPNSTVAAISQSDLSRDY